MSHFEQDREFPFERHLKKEAQQTRPAMPADVEAQLDRTLDLLPSRKRRFLKPLGLYAAIATCVLMLFSGTLAYVSPQFAQAMQSIPYIGVAFEHIGDYGLQQAAHDDLATAVNEPFTINDIHAEITDVIYDGHRLVIGYVQHINDDPDQEGNWLANALMGDRDNGLQLYYDGERISRSGGAGYNVVNDELVVGTLQLSTRSKLPDEFTLTMQLDEANMADPLNINVPIQIVDGVRIVNAEGSVEHENETIRVNHVMQTPITTVVELEWVFPDHDTELERMWGEEYLTHHFLLTDQQYGVSRIAGISSTGGPEEEERIRNTIYLAFDPMDELPESFTLVPLSSPLDESLWDELPEPEQKPVQNLPVQLEEEDENEVRVLTITDIQFEADQTIVHVRAQAAHPINHVMRLRLYTNDEEHRPLMRPVLQEEGSNVRYGEYEYVTAFPPLNPDDDIQAAVLPQVPFKPLEGFEFDVVVDKDATE